MPLIQGKSPQAVSKNISAEMSAGKPQKQALAIALNIKRKNMAKKAFGGLMEGKNVIEDKFAEGGEVPEQGLNHGKAIMEDHFAHGGMAHHIAKMVMEKLAKGGMYAAGGEVPDDSDQDLYVEPIDGAQDHEDFLSDADQMPSEAGTPEEHAEKGMGARKVMLSNIMKKMR